MSTINGRIREVIKSTKLSQEAFAKSIHRTRGEIANIVYDKVDARDEIIESICLVHRVNREWLETGTGEMYKPPTVDQAMAEIFGVAMSGADDPKSRIIRALAAMPPEDLDGAIDFLLSLAEKIKEQQ